jgi:hypothetical protein
LPVGVYQDGDEHSKSITYKYGFDYLLDFWTKLKEKIC